VLLSDQSGFLPFVYQAQGNELVSLTPWQVRARGNMAAGLQYSIVACCMLPISGRRT
jgi:hypothetical protein